MKMHRMFFAAIVRRQGLAACLIPLALVLAMAASNAPVVHAATTITVTTIDDESDAGACGIISSDPGTDGVWSLREAICATNNATGADTINITATGTITLATALPALQDSVTINGPGASNLTVSGDHTRQVFHVWMGGQTFSFQGLTIANGSATSGAGIDIDGALAVTVNDVVFSGNTATNNGGAIYNMSGQLTVTNSTFVDNTGGGGAICNDSSSTLIAANNTFSGNNGGTRSGGTILQNGSGSTALTNITVNSSDTNSAVAAAQGTLSLRNSIVVNSIGASCEAVAGTITNGGNNIDSGTTCGFGSTAGSMSSTDPKLGSLANNGGPAQTMALLADSPAINAGGATICAAAVGSPTYGAGGVDARGLSRRSGYCDIGAFEAQAASMSPTAGSSPQSAPVNTAFAHALGVHVTDAYTNTLGGVSVTYSAPSSGASAVLSATSATSNASGIASVTATANNLGGSYSVTANATGASPATFILTNTAGSTTTITSHLPHPSRPGQAVTVLYTVTSPNGTPTGNVTVGDGSANCVGTVAAGSCSLVFTTPGSKTLTATYAGDGSFGSSTSSSHPHAVNWGTNLPLLIRP